MCNNFWRVVILIAFVVEGLGCDNRKVENDAGVWDLAAIVDIEVIQDSGPEVDIGVNPDVEVITDSSLDVFVSDMCSSGQSLCNGQCVDLQTDTNNCGTCGNNCTPGDICNKGNCEPPLCLSPNMLCSGVCINPNINLNNCGSCGNVCGTNMLCTNGVCKCVFGMVDCSGVCADTTSDTQNCGACGVACASGENCVSGQCLAGTFVFEVTCPSSVISAGATVQCTATVIWPGGSPRLDVTASPTTNWNIQDTTTGSCAVTPAIVSNTAPTKGEVTAHANASGCSAQLLVATVQAGYFMIGFFSISIQ